MRLSDVQNPYDPAGWVGRVEIVQYDSVNLSTALSPILVPPDPARLWLLITTDDLITEWSVWPFQQAGQYGIRPATNTAYVLIHSASYPGAVQSQWYGTANSSPVVLQIVAGRAITNVE